MPSSIPDDAAMTFTVNSLIASKFEIIRKLYVTYILLSTISLFLTFLKGKFQFFLVIYAKFYVFMHNHLKNREV